MARRPLLPSGIECTERLRGWVLKPGRSNSNHPTDSCGSTYSSLGRSAAAGGLTCLISLG